jgi:hypothetical protein
MRIGLLNCRIGGAEDRRVRLRLIGSAQILLVSLIGLVPDFNSRQPSAVALREKGDELAKGRRFARWPRVRWAEATGNAALQQRRRCGGVPTGSAFGGHDHLDARRCRVAYQTVGERQFARFDHSRCLCFQHRPRHIGAHHLRVQSRRGGHRTVDLRCRYVVPNPHDVDAAERGGGGAAGGHDGNAHSEQQNLGGALAQGHYTVGCQQAMSPTWIWTQAAIVVFVVIGMIIAIVKLA